MSAMARYPWSVLGLEGPASEAEIKSAYARKLKNVRPDADQAAFQKLVEARSAALEILRVKKDTAQSDIDFHPQRLVQEDNADVRSKEVPIRLPALDREGFSSKVDAPTQPNISNIVVECRACLSAAREEIDAKKIDALLLALANAPASTRAYLEQEILQGAAKLPFVQQVMQAPMSKWRRIALWLGFVTIERAHDLPRERLLLALDEEFGWTHSDRRVFQAVGREDALRLLGCLQALRREKLAEFDGVQSRWDADGLPILDAEDMRAYFGRSYEFYAKIYGRFILEKKHRPTWRPLILLICPVWALAAKQFKVLAAWLIALIFIIETTNARDQYLSSYRTALGTTSSEYYALRDQLIAWTPLLLIPIVAVHIYSARNKDFLELKRVASLSSLADRKRLFAPAARTNFIKRRAPFFAMSLTLLDGRGIFKSWWFWLLFLNLAFHIVQATLSDHR
ncbi:MAG: hypothetical protein QM780_09920 [Hyphomicrobium sp.]|uniref:hypothetical protein n=1 Tax=Hyphomicrobium sp. TaxID=82 RepID=UPI0039E6015B